MYGKGKSGFSYFSLPLSGKFSNKRQNAGEVHIVPRRFIGAYNKKAP